MRKVKKILTLAVTATLLFSSMTVNAATPSITAKQNADYMMSTNKDGAPNWFVGLHYSNSYADLKSTFGDNEKALYNHSLQYGFNESRLVTPVLDVAKYRDFYPDLNKAFGNNWNMYVRHYFEYGINEGRENFTDFDAKTYLSMYDDLQNAFGTDLGLATRHYIEYGISEGREYNWPEPELSLEFKIEEDNRYEDNDSNSNNSSSSENVSDGDSSDNTTEENFTGDKRIELSDNMYSIETYVNGVLTVVAYYNSDGTVESKTTYTLDGTILKSSKSSYADGSFNEITYYETGAQKTATHYRADGTKLQYTESDEQGYTTLSIEYQADGITEESNTKLVYDENGNKKSDKTIWANGSTAETTYKNGVRTHQVDISTDGTKYETEYYEDGYTQKKETTICTDGTKIIAEFYENSNWKSRTDYDADGNITSQTFYDEDGSIIDNPATPSNATPAE